MNTKMLFKKSMLVALVAALLLAAFPLTGASAAGLYNPPTPNGWGPSNERLEKAWQRLSKAHERFGKFFDRSDEIANRAEKMIDRLKENGESTADLEAALSAFQDAVKKARPVYQSCNGIVTSHKGFDDNGKVTDAAQAIETIGELGSKMKEVRDNMDGKGKALVELMKSIRQAHRPAATPTPLSSSN